MMVYGQCPTVTVQSPVVLTCTGSVTSFSACSNYSANITSKWFGPSGELLASIGTSTSFVNINLPGTYAVQFTDNSSNCVVTETVSLSGVVGKPLVWYTFYGAFNNNCNVGNVSVQINSIQCSPIPNTPVNFAFGSVTTTPTFTNNPNVTFQNPFSCGDHYFMVQDLTNSCISSVTISVQCGTTVASPVNITGPGLVCLHSSITYTASGANTYTWLNGPNTSTYNVIPYFSDVYQVGATDINGCITHAAIQAGINAGCADVWPGDANSDGVVNNLDVFELGLAFNQTGPARSFTSNAYVSQYATTWTGTVSTGKNKSHADCNGDGIVDNSDTLAISNNFNLTHSFKTFSQSANPEVYFVLQQPEIYINEWNVLDIYAGTATEQLNNLLGLAFEVLIDSNYIEKGSYVKFTNSFFDNSQNIRFDKEMRNSQKHFPANVRTDGQAQSGNGKIAELYIKIKTGVQENSTINLFLDNISMLTSSLSIESLAGGSVTVNMINNPNSLDEYFKNKLAVTLYPNPTSSQLKVITNSEKPVHFSIYNILGEALMETEISKGETIDLSSFSPGAYQVICTSGKFSVAKKLIVNR